MNFMLNEEINERYHSSKEETSSASSVFHGSFVWRSGQQTPDSPWNGGDQVADHEDIVPVMIIG